MPDLLPPKVVGELTALNSTVRVENHQAATTLRLWVNGTEIGAKQGASAGRDEVAVNPAYLPLQVGAAITATQEDGQEVSAPSPDAVIVQAVPSTLGQAQVVGVVYACAQNVRVSGLTPGARFEVHQPGAGGAIGAASLRGHGQTYNGSAACQLDPAVSTGPLIVRQIAGGQTSDARYPMPIVTVPFGDDRKLLSATVTGALDCGWCVDLDGTINGVDTTITRERAGVSVEFFGVARDGHTQFWMPEPFQAGDVVSVTHEVSPRCEIAPSDPSEKFEVVPRVIHPPLIVPPVCRDATELQLLNVEAGADYTVFAIYTTADGDVQQVLGRGSFPAPEPESTIPINSVQQHPAQLPDSPPRLAISQTACGWTSQLSPAVPMEPLGAPVQPTLPDEHLWACAAYVRVEGVRPGSWVSVHSSFRGGRLDDPSQWMGGRIGRVKATAPTVSVPTSGLIVGDTVWACTVGCQESVMHSDPRPVESDREAPLRNLVIDDPVYPTDTAVVVDRLVVGARVVVRVIGDKHPGGQTFWSSYAWADRIPIYTGQLFEHDQITVFQSLCHPDATENQSNTVTVQLGTLSVSIAPHSVEQNAVRNMLVTATDPQRNSVPVAGDVLISGSVVAQTNKTFPWAAPGQGNSVPVQVTAPGYSPWAGTISLTTPVKPTGSTDGGGSNPPKPPTPPKVPSCTYTCKPLPGGVEFVVTGKDFPTTPPGSSVTITAEFDGIYTAFGQTHICGEEAPGTGSYGPYYVGADGSFTTPAITVLYGCQPTCSVRVVVHASSVPQSQIGTPASPYCKCVNS
ncbi:hypothetical protein [Mycobacterium sp. GA-1841]|uniref:hypothetical protein n=1 Tax=Mycobacterium sp. GA-1841 TaxID=1834154 RepID=UPI00111555EC|nr:hypothetical protein [Mycobacterium sp. GA-1841]